METLLAPFIGNALATLLTIVLGEGLFAYGVPRILQWMEQSQRFPWLSEYSGRALKISAAITGAAAAAGIKSALDLDAGTFVISGITTSALGHFALDVMRQLGLQELAYQWFLKSRK